MTAQERQDRLRELRQQWTFNLQMIEAKLVAGMSRWSDEQRQELLESVRSEPKVYETTKRLITHVGRLGQEMEGHEKTKILI